MRISHRLGTLVLAGVLSLSLAGGALAQKGAKRGGGRQGPYPPAILARLNLNADQQAKVKAAEDAFRAEQAKAQALTTPKEKRQARRGAFGLYQSAVRSALNAEQQTKLQALQAEAAEYRELGPMSMQLAGLNLSADQKSKVREIGVKYQPELQKAKASAATGDRKAARLAQREVTSKMRQEVMAVLTPEQQRQMGPAGRTKRKKKNQTL